MSAIMSRRTGSASKNLTNPATTANPIPSQELCAEFLREQVNMGIQNGGPMGVVCFWGMPTTCPSPSQATTSNRPPCMVTNRCGINTRNHTQDTECNRLRRTLARGHVWSAETAGSEGRDEVKNGFRHADPAMFDCFASWFSYRVSMRDERGSAAWNRPRKLIRTEALQSRDSTLAAVAVPRFLLRSK